MYDDGLGFFYLRDLLLRSLHLRNFLELFDRSFHSECHLVILFVEQVAVYTRRQVEHLRNFIVQLSNLGGFLEFKEFLMQLEKHILVDFVKMSLTIIPK